jgi:CheY-like chemotaxis protein
MNVDLNHFGWGTHRLPIVLLVEDDVANYELLSEHLASSGFEVHGAGDGGEALKKALVIRPDVVISDYSLPGRNGCELASALRHDRRTSCCRIVMITGSVQKQVRDQARQAGCDGFMTKPVHLDMLTDEVHRVLALRRRVLIVEDDDDLRNALEDALSEKGFDVATAENGRVALDRLRAAQTPDAILLDLMMPVMSGWELLAELRSETRLAAIPIIIMTAANKNSMFELKEQVMLEKPVMLPGLLGALRAVSVGN